MPDIVLTVVHIDPKAKAVTIKSDTQIESLLWRYWPETTTLNLMLEPDQSYAITTDGLVLSYELFGGEAGKAFADGVYQLRAFGEGLTGDVKILINKALECCLSSEIGKLAESDPDCQDTETDRRLQRLIRWRFAADVKMDLKDYDGAHNLTIAGLATCKGGCGCE